LPQRLAFAILLCLTTIGLTGGATLQAQQPKLRELSAEWWQWALSIPTPHNALIDLTGADCMVGQRGETWFLAGVFGGGEVERHCTIPEGVDLFFPIVNAMNFDTPNVCGQGPESISVRDLRAVSAAFLDTITVATAEISGEVIRPLRRVQSSVFAIALPEDNLFDALCEGVSNVPAGIYSRAVDEGVYGTVSGLVPGDHNGDAPGDYTLNISAHDASGTFASHVTYYLTVAAR
jgi:hypothetical protein